MVEERAAPLVLSSPKERRPQYATQPPGGGPRACALLIGRRPISSPA